MKGLTINSKLLGGLFGLSFLLIVTGCSSIDVERNRLVHEKLSRPSRILVYNFVANPADIPKDSSAVVAKTAKESPAMTPANIKIGRKLGSSIATQLIDQIRSMGLPAEKALATTSKPKVNDIVLHGYIVSMSQGDTLTRVTIGFGYGASELASVVEGFQMTQSGLRKLGAVTLKSGGSKAPGGGVGAFSLLANGNPAGLIVGGVVKGYGELSGSSKVEGRAKAIASEISNQLKIRFKEEGWIK